MIFAPPRLRKEVRCSVFPFHGIPQMGREAQQQVSQRQGRMVLRTSGRPDREHGPTLGLGDLHHLRIRHGCSRSSRQGHRGWLQFLPLLQFSISSTSMSSHQMHINPTAAFAPSTAAALLTQPTNQADPQRAEARANAATKVDARNDLPALQRDTAATDSRFRDPCQR